MNIAEIENILRHRYPFLLIDRVTECEPGKSAKGLKNVTINESFFQGHFPDEPIMPGVLILEAMAQLSAIILGDKEKCRGLLTSVYGANFLKPVLPGDQMLLESQVMQRVKNLFRVKATAKVNGVVVAKAELGFVVL